MLCRKPYKKGPQFYGCGQCTPCRINKARSWTARMMLEAKEHPYSSFVTLTYNDEHLPKDGSVSKREVQLFLKKLRQAIAPRKLRFYAVGEYGDKTWRPHYHLIIFGLSPTEWQTVENCWKNGFIKVGSVQSSSIGYVAQYCLKKMTNPKDIRLDGRLPEFALMSLKPGIGYGYVDRTVAAYLSVSGQAGLNANGWIGRQIRIEGKLYSADRYLRHSVVKKLGLDNAQRLWYNSQQFQNAFNERRGKTLEEITVERKARTDQQNSQVRIKRRYL